jgi:hypothetical protein
VPASPRCPARQPERLISRPATTASHTQSQRFGRPPRQASNATLEASFFWVSSTVSSTVAPASQ